ncbi:MAG: hypothetical protein BGN96_05105 [Bacteroidales bacterium 45-6]|nr:MAG: hypothetical protein BGN96_05105 [Bacteroidales bacterium 45-6]
MSFALTKYIYPIENSIVLSESMRLKFDNPRSSEEINTVKEFIQKTLIEKDKGGNERVASLSSRLGFSLGDLKEKLREIDEDDYALKYYDKNYEKSLIDILAETWIIVRFSDDKEFDDITKDRDILLRIVLSKDETDYAKKFKDLASYCHIISLLSHNDEEYYHGESFLLSTNPYELFSVSVNQRVYEAVETFLGHNFLFKEENRGLNWLYWIDGFEEICSQADGLETLLIDTLKREEGKIRLSQKETPKQKILHIGNLLKTSYEHLKDPELMLLILVSIIEYLITRNPDTNRFNIEDSISRQFKLKCAIIIHNQDTEYDLVQLNKELGVIYSQRSDFAHGNYKSNFKIEDILSSVYSLYKFNKYIINEFIEDRVLIEYLKDN